MAKVHWYKVKKYFRGGSREGYVPVYPKEDAELTARAWADDTEGGSESGWTVYWEKVERPSAEWAEKEIKRTNAAIEALKEKLRFLSGVNNANKRGLL